LTYYTDHHLGVFVGSYEADGRYRLQNAGGYYLNQSVVPVNTFPLKVGSVKTGLFSGSVGPVGVFSKPDLHTDLKRILKNLIKEPSSLPTVLEEKNVIFWSPDGKSDIGPQNHEIRLVEPIKLKSNEIKG